MNEQLGVMGPPVVDMDAAIAGGNPQPQAPLKLGGASTAPAPAQKQPLRWSMVDGAHNLSPEWKLRANARLAKKKGFWENVSVKPFLGTAEDVYTILEMNQIGAKIGLGKASREETEKYYDWFIDKGLRENNFWGSIGELGSGSVEFGVEMAVGGGIVTGAAKKFAGAALAKAAEKASTRFLSKLAVGAAATGVTTGLQEAVPSAINAGMGRGYTGGAWTRNMLDVTLGSAEFTDEEKVRLVDDMNAAVAIAYERGGSLLKGFALQAADVATESLGGPLSKLTPVSHLNGLFGAVTRKLAGRLPKREFFKAMADAAQFQGPFVEVLEEYIAEASKVAIGNGKTLPEAMSELTGNLPEMLTTFALPGLGGAAATRVSDAARLAMGQQVDGRQGVAGGLSEQRPGPDATGAPGPQGPGAPTPVGPEVKRRALENYATAYEKTYSEPLPKYDEVAPSTAEESIAARVLEAGGAPYVLVRTKGGAKTRGFYDPETGAIVVDVDGPFVARTAHHELAHAMWARWSPEKRQEFVSSLDEADATFLPEALAAWRESAGGAQASEQLEQNESVATGAEAIAPAMEFLATPRGAKLAEMAEAARPGRARRIFEFGADFLRALAGRAPQAPTTALRAFERALSAEKGSGKQVATIAKRYTAAFEEASKAFREAPATPSSYSGEDVYNGLDLGGMLQETQADEPGPMDNWTAPQTGSAVWSNAGKKTRVEVVGRAGLARDGSELARIRGTTVGVPYAQLKFDEPPAAKAEEPESKKRDRGGKRAKAAADREAAAEVVAQSDAQVTGSNMWSPGHGRARTTRSPLCPATVMPGALQDVPPPRVGRTGSARHVRNTRVARDRLDAQAAPHAPQGSAHW